MNTKSARELRKNLTDAELFSPPSPPSPLKGEGVPLVFCDTVGLVVYPLGCYNYAARRLDQARATLFKLHE
jgi:hypothetical protein